MALKMSQTSSNNNLPMKLIKRVVVKIMESTPMTHLFPQAVLPKRKGQDGQLPPPGHGLPWLPREGEATLRVTGPAPTLPRVPGGQSSWGWKMPRRQFRTSLPAQEPLRSALTLPGPGSPCSRNFVSGGCWSFRENTLREHRTDTKEMMALPFLLFCIVSLSPLTFQPYSENYSSPPKVTPFP